MITIYLVGVAVTATLMGYTDNAPPDDRTLRQVGLALSWPVIICFAAGAAARDTAIKWRAYRQTK